MKYILTVISLVFVMFVNAQKVTQDGKVYEVKKEKIFLDGKEVTATLNLEEKTSILNEASTILKNLKIQEEAEKENKKLEKEKVKAEKALKKAEKAQKKAEKEIKKRAKLQSNFKKAEANFDKTKIKYENLKRKGKLSPVDESKWLKKLEGLTKKLNKAKSKL